VLSKKNTCVQGGDKKEKTQMVGVRYIVSARKDLVSAIQAAKELINSLSLHRNKQLKEQERASRNVCWPAFLQVYNLKNTANFSFTNNNSKISKTKFDVLRKNGEGKTTDRHFLWSHSITTPTSQNYDPFTHIPAPRLDSHSILQLT